MADTKLKVVLVGNGFMASYCARTLSGPDSRYDLVYLLVDGGPRRVGTGLEVFAEKTGLPYRVVSSLRETEVVELFESVRADLLVSICNSLVAPDSILALVRKTVNFHNSPLPKFAGFHSCTWALAMGEKTYGVSFHVINGEIDGGPLLAQSFFPISEGMNARDLLIESIDRGLSLFKSDLSKILDLETPGVPQEAEQRSYFAPEMLPNDGFVNLAWSASEFANHLRAFDYRPLNSPVGQLKIKVDDSVWRIESASPTSGDFAKKETGYVARSAEKNVLVLKDGSFELNLVR